MHGYKYVVSELNSLIKFKLNIRQDIRWTCIINCVNRGFHEVPLETEPEKTASEYFYKK